MSVPSKERLRRVLQEVRDLAKQGVYEENHYLFREIIQTTDKINEGEYRQ